MSKLPNHFLAPFQCYFHGTFKKRSLLDDDDEEEEDDEVEE
jgi:hypothetical protein